ncbi:MAG: hypothetical protein MHPSP_001148 [Paramarteilia canceri]
MNYREKDQAISSKDNNGIPKKNIIKEKFDKNSSPRKENPTEIDDNYNHDDSYRQEKEPYTMPTPYQMPIILPVYIGCKHTEKTCEKIMLNPKNYDELNKILYSQLSNSYKNNFERFGMLMPLIENGNFSSPEHEANKQDHTNKHNDSYQLSYNFLNKCSNKDNYDNKFEQLSEEQNKAESNRDENDETVTKDAHSDNQPKKKRVKKTSNDNLTYNDKALDSCSSDNINNLRMASEESDRG